jgi:fatty acid desaturase
MEDRAFEGGAMHGPPGGWDFVEAIGTFSAFLLLLVLLALLAWGAYRLIPRLRVGAWADPAEGILRERLDILRSSRAQGAFPERRYGSSLRRTYEDYVREAMNRLRAGRGAGS